MLLWDKTLSVEAKGLMCYLLSCKYDCNFTIEKIMYNTNTKRRKMDRIMQELISKGYLEKKIIKDERGIFVKHDIIAHEDPIIEAKKTDIMVGENKFDYDCIEKTYCGGYVYLAKMGEHYKIGISQNPKSRLKEFTKLPYPLEIILCEKVNSYEVVEKELHNHFKKQHIRGEWFKLNHEDIDFIKTYLDLNK